MRSLIRGSFVVGAAAMRHQLLLSVHLGVSVKHSQHAKRRASESNARRLGDHSTRAHLDCDGRVGTDFVPLSLFNFPFRVPA